MSTSAAGPLVGRREAQRPIRDRLRAYFWSDSARRVQTVLGLLWLLDGGLQFQSFMYSRGFVQMIASGAAGQPGWLHDSILWGARFANGDIAVWNTLFGLTQVLLGVGLLYRPLVKPALAASFAWVLVVWWFGEAFGMLFMDMAQPLTGAPGGVLMYALVGLLAWPSDRPGGLLGIRGARTMWGVLWIAMAWLWLLAPSSSANATRDALTSVPSGIGGLDHLQRSLASAAAGNGLAIALVLAALTAAIGIAVAADWHGREFLIAAIVLNLGYWVIPQGLGGMFAGGATDPNSGPLFVLLACAMFPLVSRPPRRRGRQESAFELRESQDPDPSGHRVVHAVRAGVLAGGCALALAACGSSAGLTGTGSQGAGGMSAMKAKSASSSGGGMSGMNMKQMTSGAVDGVKPIPTQMLAAAQWQHMKITARAMTAVPFVIFNGGHERMVKPPRNTSFHLMVMLDDARSGVPIPYASVWATIRKAGKVVYDERQWPMLSEYMGPHYGNDVSVPGPGHYTLSLLISPPVSARHIEYQHVWLKPHRVTVPFTWKGGAT